MEKQQQILDIARPKHPLPVVYDSPHSGTIWPAGFAVDCARDALHRIEDRYIDDLFAAAPTHDATLLRALFPRCYIDVNRARDDIDVHLLADVWPAEKYGPISPTPRSDAGIGLIPRLIRPGTPIYNHKIGAEEVMHRIMTCYDPYHAALKSLLEEAYYHFGQFWHINCHSMPSASAFPKTNITIMGGKAVPSDIVLGDRDGTTCSREFMAVLRDFWLSLGYRVTINDPFKGVELVQRYAQPTRGRNSVQIEFNRALFMDEETGEKSKNYAKLQEQIQRMMAFVSEYVQSKMTSLAAD